MKRDHVKKVLTHLDLAINKIKTLDYRELSEQNYLDLINEIEGLFRYARRYYKRHSENLEAKVLYFKALSAKLGGTIPFEVFLHPYYQCFRMFVESNALQHKMQMLKMRVEMDEDLEPAILVADEKRESHLLAWKSLIQNPICDRGRIVGYAFYHFDREVFRVDTQYRLFEEYILTFRGITQCHPHENQKIIAFDRRDPSEWGYQYVVEIWTMLKNSKDDRPTIGIGDHCHLILKDQEGYVYSMGKFGAGKPFTFRDAFTLFSAKKGRFISPDFFSYYSESTRNVKKKQFIITKEQFDRLYQTLLEHKRDKSPIFTLLKHNCAGYVKKIFKEVLKIDIDSELYLPHFLLKAFLSKRLYQALVFRPLQMIQKCPKWLQKAFYFFPPLYLGMVIAGLLIRLLSFGSSRYLKADISLKDIFITPWNVTIHHPVALRD